MNSFMTLNLLLYIDFILPQNNTFVYTLKFVLEQFESLLISVMFKTRAS